MFGAHLKLVQTSQRAASRAAVAVTPARTILNLRTSQSDALDQEMFAEDGEVFTTFYANLRTITLNRPKQLNALNHNMVKLIAPRLRSDELNENCQSIVISGSGNKAFCAGGDIVLIVRDADLAKRGDDSAYDRYMAFFRDEYRLNYLTSKLSKPYIPFMNGITMGGGVGLSVHSRYRVATENTLFAMPETAIGFFPDVGGSHFLPRLDTGVGMYLGLTGARLKAADLVHAGIATHFAISHEKTTLINRLTDGHEHAGVVIRALNHISQAPEVLTPFTLAPHLDCIARCFTKGSVEEIIEALTTEAGSSSSSATFAADTLRLLSKMSPLSLKITHEQLTRGSRMTLDACLKQEYRIAQNMITNPDFSTGVHALLIHKHGKPQWQHKSLADVPESSVASFFDLPAGGKELDFDGAVPKLSPLRASVQRLPYVVPGDAPPGGEDPYPLWVLPESVRNFTGERLTHYAALNNHDFFEKYWSFVLLPPVEGAEEYIPMTHERLQKQMDRLSEAVYVDDANITAASQEAIAEGDNSAIASRIASQNRRRTPEDVMESIEISRRGGHSVEDVASTSRRLPGTILGTELSYPDRIETLWGEMEASTRELLARVSSSLGPNQKRLYLLTLSPADLVSEDVAYETLKRFGLQVEAADASAAAAATATAAGAAPGTAAAADAIAAAENAPAALQSLPPPAADAADDASLVAEALGKTTGRFATLPDGREDVTTASGAPVVMLGGAAVPLDDAGLARARELLAHTGTAADVANFDAFQADPLLDRGLITRYFAYSRLRQVDLQERAKLEGRFVHNLTNEVSQAKVTMQAARVVVFCGFDARRVEYLRLQLRYFYRWFARAAGMPEAMAPVLARLELGSDEVEALGLFDAARTPMGASQLPFNGGAGQGITQVDVAQVTRGALTADAVLAKITTAAPGERPALGVPYVDRLVLKSHEEAVLQQYIAATNPDLAEHLANPPSNPATETTASALVTNAFALSLGVASTDSAVSELVEGLPTSIIAAAGNADALRAALAPSALPKVADWVTMGYTAEEAEIVAANPVVNDVLVRFRKNEPMTVDELTLVAALPSAPPSLKERLVRSAASVAKKHWYNSSATDPNARHFTMEEFFAAADAVKEGESIGKPVPEAIFARLQAADAAASASAAASAAANPSAASAEADPVASLVELLDLRVPAPGAKLDVATLRARVAMNRYVLKHLDEALSAHPAAAAVTAAEAAPEAGKFALDEDLAAAADILGIDGLPSSIVPPAPTADPSAVEALRVENAIRAAQVAFLTSATASPAADAEATAAAGTTDLVAGAGGRAARRIVALAERLANLRARALSSAPAPGAAPTAAAMGEELAANRAAGGDAASLAERYLAEDRVFATAGHQELTQARETLRLASSIQRKAVLGLATTTTVDLARARPSVHESLVPTNAATDAVEGREVVTVRAELPWPLVSPEAIIAERIGEKAAHELFVVNGGKMTPEMAAQDRTEVTRRLSQLEVSYINHESADLTRWSMAEDALMNHTPHDGAPIQQIEDPEELNRRAFLHFLGVDGVYRNDETRSDYFLHTAPGAAHDADNARGSGIVLSNDPAQYFDFDSFNVSVPAVPSGYYAPRRVVKSEDKHKIFLSGLRLVSRGDVLSGDFPISEDTARRLGIDYHMLQKKVTRRATRGAAEVRASAQANLAAASVLAAKLKAVAAAKGATA